VRDRTIIIEIGKRGLEGDKRVEHPKESDEEVN